jgi:UDP-3-O-[3-hydroxymyristoyl] glucosamine N-acyltransferase
MDIIQLQDKQDGWCIHHFADTASRDAVLATHDIRVGQGVTIADYVMLGDHCVIGDRVHLSEESVVSHHCHIGEGTLLDTGAFVSKHSQIGSNCVLAVDSFVGPNSTVGDGCSIGHSSELGDKVRLGNNISIGQGSYIMDETDLKEGTTIGQGVFIGKRTQGGFFVMIGDDAKLVSDVHIQDEVSIMAGSMVQSYSRVTRNGTQVEKDRIEKAIAQMGKTIRFDQLATFTSLECVRCIRAQFGGVWLPSKRVDMADSYAFSEGKMSLRDMADKYIVPDYVRDTIAQEEVRAAGIRR